MAGLLPFRLGPFMVAVRTGASVVPVVIRGTRHVLRDGTWVPRPGTIEVEVLDAIATGFRGHETAWPALAPVFGASPYLSGLARRRPILS